MTEKCPSAWKKVSRPFRRPPPGATAPDPIKMKRMASTTAPLALKDHPFVYGNAYGSSRDDYPQASYSAGGMANPSPSYSSARSFSINSNVSSSLTGFTPTVTAAPRFPSIHQQSQTLPSFSAAFGMPSILAVLHHKRDPQVFSSTEKSSRLDFPTI